MNLIPLGKRLIVKKPEVEAENKTASGFIISAAPKDPEPEGPVVAIGEEVTKVTIGDVVVFPQYGLIEIEDDGTDYYIINEEDLLVKRKTKKK